MDLLSIVAPAAEVSVGSGQTVSVRGVSLRDIALLLARFPELLQLFNGRDLDAQRLLKAAPDAASAIMAAAAGHANDPAAEKFCDGLGLAVQTEMLIKIMELTFPSGLGPFVEALERLNVSLPKPTAAANGAAPGQEAPTMS